MKKGAALRRGTTPVQTYIAGGYLGAAAEACQYFGRSKGRLSFSKMHRTKEGAIPWRTASIQAPQARKEAPVFRGMFSTRLIVTNAPEFRALRGLQATIFFLDIPKYC